MSVILDILGSFIIRAAIVVVILNMMINLHQSLSKNSDRISLNTSLYGHSDTSSYFRNKFLGGTSQIIAADLKLAGYRGASSPNKNFAIAQSHDISFYADTGNTGTQQTIRYYTNPASPSSANAAILYRTVDGASQMEIASNVTKFDIIYYTVSGSTTSGYNISGVKSIKITLEIKSTISERTYYSTSSDTSALTAKWEQHFFPENL